MHQREKKVKKMSKLEIKNLKVSVEGKLILKGVILTINKGEIHALMGQNGSGKTTLAKALMGHPKYVIEEGQILLNGEDITEASPDERARKGLFMTFQYPVEISGVSLLNFLRAAKKAREPQSSGEEKFDVQKARAQELINALKFKKYIKGKLELVGVDETFVNRYLNEGFSGGEKKRSEILQLATLEPEFAILDEIDSGLDIDALKIVADAVKSVKAQHEMGLLLITHYQRILNYIKPHHIHVMMDGRIIKSGGPELAKILEEKGYKWIEEEIAINQSI